MPFSDITEVRSGSHVTIHYRLSLHDGQDVVNTFTSRPATVLIGAGQMALFLEAILIGMKPGSHSVFQLTPQQAFGLHNPDLVKCISHTTLRAHGAAEEGYLPGDVVAFNAPAGGRWAGVFREMGKTGALFDFNHPLAGQALEFEVQIIGIL